MAGDLTYQGAKRISFLPERDAEDNGSIIAGQEYDNVYFQGGVFDNAVMDSATITNSVISGTIGGFTASRAIASDVSGNLVVSASTATELSYLSGVTSAIQTQLNAKQGTITLTTTGSSGAATLVGNTLNIPNYSAPTGQALTRTNDTNVTVTLGGTPASALLQAVSLTLGWTGSLAVGRGGTGVVTLTGLAKGNGTSAFTAAVEGTDYYGPGGTDVAIADGGTGASTAATAFSNLKQAATTGATGVVQKATQADMEAQTADRYGDAASLKYHPGVAKAFVVFNASTGTPTIESSYNVTSITDNSVGDFTVNFTVPFSSAVFASNALAGDRTNAQPAAACPYTRSVTASSIRLVTFNITGTLVDYQYVCGTWYGDQ